LPEKQWSVSPFSSRLDWLLARWEYRVSFTAVYWDIWVPLKPMDSLCKNGFAQM
jgi:hypothetical protein